MQSHTWVEILCGGGDVPVDVTILGLLKVSEFILFLDSVAGISLLECIVWFSIADWIPVDVTVDWTDLFPVMCIGISLGGDGPTAVDTVIFWATGLAGGLGISIKVLLIATRSWLLTTGNGDGVATESWEWESEDVVVSLSEGADGTDLVSDKESLNSVWREFLCAISVVFSPSRISPTKGLDC